MLRNCIDSLDIAVSWIVLFISAVSAVNLGYSQGLCLYHNILPNAFKGTNDGDIMLTKDSTRPNPRNQQQLRRVKYASCEYHFFLA